MKVRFLEDGLWGNGPRKPTYKVTKGDVREVGDGPDQMEPARAHYAVDTGRAEFVPDTIETSDPEANDPARFEAPKSKRHAKKLAKAAGKALEEAEESAAAAREVNSSAVAALKALLSEE